MDFPENGLKILFSSFLNNFRSSMDEKHAEQYEILVHGYDPDNDELVRYNTKILIATQDFIYDTKRFCDKNKPSVPPPAQAPVPPHAPFPAPPHAPLPVPPI